MSHFSKIKTNITDLDALIKTIGQLGFDYKLSDINYNNLSIENDAEVVNVSVYQKNNTDNQLPVFSFLRDGKEYILIADVQLWTLDIDFNYLLDCLFQQYAYNMVISTSGLSGFNKIQEELSCDGSIKITLQKWSSN